MANATLSGSWTGGLDGTYTASYTAIRAGTGLKAVLNLPGWSQGSDSAAYAITAGAPAQATSGVKTDKTSYVAGSDMMVTVTLKDANGNPVTGKASSLTAEAVTVANASLNGIWTDNQDGTYVASYTATKEGTGLKATLGYTGWDGEVYSKKYAIIILQLEIVRVEVNGNSLDLNKSFSGVMFKNASFTITLNENADDFSSSEELTVKKSNEDKKYIVTFVAQPLKDLTITMNKEGYKSASYTLKVSEYPYFLDYYTDQAYAPSAGNEKAADRLCKANGGELPSLATFDAAYKLWGNLSKYGWVYSDAENYRTSETRSDGGTVDFNISNGVHEITTYNAWVLKPLRCVNHN
ncbi:hypothetical protein IFU24_12755 [Erwinia persicina]|nr:hypothetical protein [Erwinia persicina]